MFLAGGMIGLALGIVVTYPVALLMAAHQRRRDANADAVAANILRGYAGARDEGVSTGRHAVRTPIFVEDSWLTDTGGALAQARAHAAAFMPYPGNDGSRILGGDGKHKLDEPDEAWLAWLQDGHSPDYYTGRDQFAVINRAAEVARLYPNKGTARVMWSITGYALASLGWTRRTTIRMARSTFGHTYPWWQKVADRVWECSVLFETHGTRVNRAIQHSIDAYVEVVYWLSVDLRLWFRLPLTVWRSR